MAGWSCGFCDGVLVLGQGRERSGSDYGGAYKAVDAYSCSGCERRFRHVVKETFGGGQDYWLGEDANGQPCDVDETRRPRRRP